MFKKEMMVRDEGGKEIIIEVGLAVIGVALLVIFRKSAIKLVEDLITAAQTNINDLFVKP